MATVVLMNRKVRLSANILIKIQFSNYKFHYKLRIFVDIFAIVFPYTKYYFSIIINFILLFV